MVETKTRLIDQCLTLSELDDEWESQTKLSSYTAHDK